MIVEILSVAIPTAISIASLIFVMGKTSKQVEVMEENQKDNREDLEKSIVEIKNTMVLMEAKLEQKKLDKEVFEEFAKNVEKNNDINNEQHNRIIDKLDLLIGKVK
jgi:hypothetical protein